MSMASNPSADIRTLIANVATNASPTVAGLFPAAYVAFLWDARALNSACRNSICSTTTHLPPTAFANAGALSLAGVPEDKDKEKEKKEGEDGEDEAATGHL